MEFNSVIKRLCRALSRIPRTISQFISLIPSKSRKKVFLLGSPEHDNLGDHAIAIAERKWIEDNLPDYEVLEFTDNQLTQDYNLRLRLLPLLTNSKDYVFLPGGGNLGNRYPYIEGLRRRVIKYFRSLPIIMFPQSMYFSTDDIGKKEKEKTGEIYNSHSKLTLLFRDEVSYMNAKEMFPKCRVMLVPDIVTYVDYEKPVCPDRSGILLCMRSDIEAFFDKEQISELERKLSITYSKLRYGDTSIGKNVQRSEREKLVSEQLEMFKSCKVVITDRFHGLIFSVITGTPCVVLRSKDHKIVEGVKWFKNLNYIFFTEDISEVCMLTDYAMKLREPSEFNFKKEYFDKLKDCILT